MKISIKTYRSKLLKFQSNIMNTTYGSNNCINYAPSSNEEPGKFEGVSKGGADSPDTLSDKEKFLRKI